MKLKLKKAKVERVQEYGEYIDPLANRALLDDFHHDWLAMEAENERLSKALAGMPCERLLRVVWKLGNDIALQNKEKLDNCGNCPPCLERAKNEAKTPAARR